jgi:hypothetical protein
MPGHAKDNGGWPIRTRAMRDAALGAAKAAAAKDIEAMLIAGGHLYLSCVGCHQQYVPQMVVPLTRP